MGTIYSLWVAWQNISKVNKGQPWERLIDAQNDEESILYRP
jgi:hypothetical protein